MPERVKQIWGRVRDFFKSMKKGMKIGLAAGGAALLVLVAVLVIVRATRPYTILFTGLSPEDMTAVVTALEGAGYTDVKFVGDDTIKVRENQADRLRALVIQQGFPTSGYGYGTYLDNIGALSSSADRQQLALFELQERLASTIKWFDGVSDARVNITPGEDHRYILDETVLSAKASIIVKMQSGKTLNSNQVSAIQRLVANAQQGLEIDNVTVEDGAGSRYTSGSGIADALDDTMKYKLSLEDQVNEQVRNSIMSVLVPIVGVDNVEVSVHSTVDVTRTYTESLIYREPEWAADGSTGGRGIIGSQIWDNSLIRSGDAAAGGVVGEPNNSEINEYVTQQGQIRGDENEIYNSGEIEYRISQDSVQREQPPGTITDLTVAIAVNSAEINLQNPANFIHLAATAAGISTDVEAQKVAIVSYPFYQSRGGSGSAITEISMIFGLPAWAVYAAIAGIALFLALLLIILLLRSKKKKRIALLLAEEEAAAAAAAEAAEAEAAAAAAAAAQGADIMEVHTEEIMQIRKDVRKFVEENPSIAAQMLKNWLRGEEA